MPINKLNWINKIQVKSSKHASNNIGQNLSRKLTAEKRIFLPDLHKSKNYDKNSYIQRMKVCSYSKNVSSFGVTE